MNGIEPEEDNAIREEYKFFLDAFIRVKQISLSKDENILYEDTLVGNFMAELQ